MKCVWQVLGGVAIAFAMMFWINGCLNETEVGTSVRARGGRSGTTGRPHPTQARRSEMKYLMLVLAVLFCGASSALAGEYICAPEASSCFGEICVDLTYTNTGGSPHCNVDAVGWDCVYDSDKLEFVGVQIMGELGHFDETAYNDGVYEDCKIAENCRRLRISGIDVYEFHCLSTSVWAKVTFNIIPSGSGSTVLEQCGYTADINACTPCQTTIDW